MSLRRNRQNARPKKSVGVETAEIEPRTMLSNCTGVDSRPTQASL